eukprot:Nk52_evm16s2367 gene=Nk52_evmTU16s2367
MPHKLNSSGRENLSVEELDSTENEDAMRRKRVKLDNEESDKANVHQLESKEGDLIRDFKQMISKSRTFYNQALALEEEKEYYFASRLYEKAIELHHVGAMLKLAMYYERGHGVRLDKNQALKLYEKALDHGSGPAKLLAGSLLEKMGEKEKAKEYYEEGKDEGCEKCSSRLTALTQRATPPPSKTGRSKFQMALDLYHGLNGVEMDRIAAVKTMLECATEKEERAKTFLAIMSKFGMDEVSTWYTGFEQNSKIKNWYSEFVKKRPPFKFWDELEEMIVLPRPTLGGVFGEKGTFELCDENESTFVTHHHNCAFKYALGWNSARLTCIPAEIGLCSKLEILFCSENKLQSLPKELGECTFLQRLRCPRNKLTKLPKELWNCKALKELDFKSNSVITLPRELGKCTALQEIYCSKNELLTLPEELGECKKLRLFDCSHNMLSALPKALGKCESLESVDCCDNQLTGLPKELRQCSKLSEIYCKGNKF